MAVQVVHDFFNGFLVPFRGEVEVTLQGETLVGAVLDRLPYFVIEDVELGEKGSVRDVVEPGHGHAVALDEILDHLHPVHIGGVHRGDLVLEAVGQVLLRHPADGLGLVDDIILAEPFVPAVDGKVGPHHNTPDEPLFLVHHGVRLHPAGVVERLEVAHHGGIVHQRDFHHPAVIVHHQRVIYG